MEKYNYSITGWLIHDAGQRTMSMQCIYKCEIMTEFYNKDEMLDIMNIVAKNLRKKYTIDETHHISIDLRHNGDSVLSLCISRNDVNLQTELTDWDEVFNDEK